MGTGSQPAPSPAVPVLAAQVAARVFVSHSTKDSAAAHNLRDLLEQRGHRCWLAPDDLGPGRSWAGQIDEAIRACDALVLLLTSSAEASEHVAREVALAVDQQIPILPVRLEAVALRGSLNYLLSLVQWVDAFPGRLEQHWDPVLAGLEYLLSGGRASLRERAPAPGVPLSRGKHLPAQLSSFVGRSEEILEIRELLRYTRLLTLTGPGGVGKTRLALEVAEAEAAAFPGGAVFVGLAPLTDPGLVLAAIATELGVADVGTASLLDTLRDALGEQRILVVLDNLEHLLAAAPRISDLLLAVPGLHALATSRARLDIQGEREWRVQPLPVAEAGSEAPDTGDAVSLFVERARAVDPRIVLNAPNLRTVTRICERLDGLPLAIELAAARAGILTVDQILQRLEGNLALLTAGRRDAADRHLTLAAAVDWSYQLLSPDAKRLFEHVAIYSGGFTLDAIETTMATGDEAANVLDSLAQLESSSLSVAVDRPYGRRFTMLETIGQFARSVLDGRPADASAAQDRHADYFTRLAEQGRAGLIGPERSSWVARLADEHDNVRAALRHALDRGDRPVATRLAAFSRRFWNEHGHPAEGREWLRRVLAMPGDVDPKVHGMALTAAGSLAFLQGDLGEAELLLRRGLDVQRGAGDRDNLPNTLSNLGMCLWRKGDLGSAQEALAESVDVALEVGNRRAAAVALENLGGLLLESGELEASREQSTRALEMLEETGDRIGITIARANLGGALLAGNRLVEAEPLLTAALDEARAQEYPHGIAISEAWVGLLKLGTGDSHAAASFIRSALEAMQELGDRHGMLDVLEYAARIMARFGRPAEAAFLWGATNAAREAMAVLRQPVDEMPLAEAIQRARGELGEDVFEAAWHEGTEVDLATAATRGLAVLGEMRAETPSSAAPPNVDASVDP